MNPYLVLLSGEYLHIDKSITSSGLEHTVMCYSQTAVLLIIGGENLHAVILSEQTLNGILLLGWDILGHTDVLALLNIEIPV